MRSSILASILLPSLIQALSSASVTRHIALTTITDTPSSQSTVTSILQPSQPATPQPPTAPEPPTAPQPQSPNPFFPPKLPFGTSLHDFISSLQQPMEDTSEIDARQNGVALGGGAAGAAPLPTPGQVSPTTIYDASGTPVTYVQTFLTPLDQGPTASVGSIGMGSLTGAIGVVRTDEAASKAVSLRVSRGVSWLLGICAMAILGGMLVV